MNKDNYNTSNFPLYKILLDKVKYDTKNNKKEQKILNKDIKLFIEFINDNEDKHEIIFTIIRLFTLNTNKNNSEIYNIPFNGKETKLKNSSDFSFDFKSFPLLLQQMLIQFVKINE